MLKELRSSMPFQPIEEKETERQVVEKFAATMNFKVIGLQPDIDNGGADGIIEKNGKEYPVEVRRKGFPNHKRIISNKFKKGWDSECLKSGIYLNESTVRNHKHVGFIFIVEIEGSKPRYCAISPKMIAYLLKQDSKPAESTNSKSIQLVKNVPLDWFHEYY